MGAKLYFDKWNFLRLGIAMAATGILCLISGVPVWFWLAFGALYFLIKSFEIHLPEKLPWVWTAVMLVTGALFSIWQVQYILLDGDLRAKLTGEKWMVNFACALVFFFIVQMFTNKASWTCIICHIFIVSLSGVDYFVYMLRGNEFIFSDFKSMATGLSVAGGYEFGIEPRAAMGVLVTVLYVALVRRFHSSFKHRIHMEIICAGVAALCCVFVAAKVPGYTTETWEQKGSYLNGYILNFVLSARDSVVTAPDGYSDEAVAALEERYADGAVAGGSFAAGIRTAGAGIGTSSNSAATEKFETGESPTIIAIMSESYSDLRKVGDFETNIDVTPYFDSLIDRGNIIKGYALSSVYGSKTANSEWEFLTGNSMAFLPSGSVVYQQYISKTPTSLVSTLKNLGYTCVAMHPYYATGWKRDIVYPNMGFDEMYFIDDFEDAPILREYIKDEALFDKIIDRYEEKEDGEQLFLWGVTMQNHGGYTEKYDNFDEQVSVLNMSYPNSDQYLSLLHESDAALEDFITYFEGVDEPVEIIFFGDHLPSLSSGFYAQLNGKGLSGLTTSELEDLYTVPFFIWTNYESETVSVDMTSINYLSTMALERAGIALPSYNAFLADMMEDIPAVNSRGYYSVSAGKYKHVDAAEGEEAEWLLEYNILEYNGMFDKKAASELFFPYLK